jgi:peptidoglycan/xylan/chitin deacetylase (PgdA/CDA1 family)
VLGYRTDPDLAKTAEEGNENAEEYGTFDYEAEIEAAKPVVQALKDDGWELASHSYGHISYGSSFEKVKEDADKWQERVANVIGPTDILIFPFGTDIGSWNEYAEDNQTYQYLHDQGFRFFCNVDSNPYWVQIREDYVRQGRRNLDGYRMYQDLYNGADKLSDLFDVSQVFDQNRPETGLQTWDGAE